MSSAIGHSYLQSRNSPYNGGIIANILSEINIINNTNQLTVQMGNINIAQYVGNYFLNISKYIPIFDSQTGIITNYQTIPNNNIVTTSFGLIFFMLVIIFCLLFAIFWMIWRALRDIPQIQFWKAKIHEIIFLNKKNVSSNIGSLTILSKKTIENNKKKIYDKNLIICIICGIFTISYIICFIFAAQSQTILGNQLTGSDNNSSLMSSWQQASQNIDLFFNRILIDSYQMFNQTITIMSNSTQNLLTTSLNNLTNNLMYSFNVTSLFTTLQNLMANLNVTVTSMNYIKSNSPNFLTNISQLQGKFLVYQPSVKKYMQYVCDSQIPKSSQCQQYLTDSDQLYVPINTQNINTESSVNMLFVLQQFNLNLSQLALQVQSLQKSFNATLQGITMQKVNELNIGQSINNVVVVWNYISTFGIPAQNNFNQISNTMSTNITKVVQLLLIISSLFLAFIFILFLIYIISTMRYSIKYYFGRIIHMDKMNAAPSRPIFILHHNKKQQFINKLEHKYKPSNCMIYTYLIIFSFITILLIIFSILYISIGEIIYNEICVQLWNPVGLQNTDKVINSFLSSQWGIISNYVSSLSSSIPINLSKPNQILYSIQNNCINDTGLLQVLQLTNLINMSSFIWSQQNLNVLKSGLNMTYNTIIGIDTSNLVPPDMTNFLQMASNITKYFDGIDYTVTINELSKGVIALNNLSQWLNNTIFYFSSINNQNALILVQNLMTIQSELPTITNLQVTANNLNNNYIQIQQRRVNNDLIVQLLNDVNLVQANFIPSPKTYNTVANAYGIIMMNNFPKLLDTMLSDELRSLMVKIFPCQSLSQAIFPLINNVCNTNQMIETFTNHGFILIILSVFLIFMFHMNWILIKIDFYENSEKNISTC